MSQAPLVSVLMTVYNREKYLATAIESALAQTLRDIEIIILDDCSTDSSWQIAQSYAADPRIRLYHNEKNLRQFPTRNKIASLAHGKYLKYLDSDDALLPHCLEMMAHMMERHPEAGMLLWSSEGEPWYPFVLQPAEIYRRRFDQGQRLERAPLSTLLRKDAFDSVGGFSLAYPLCADMELIYRLARSYPALYGPHGLVFYRIHDGQVIATEEDSHLKHRSEEYRILCEALRHPDCPLPPDEKAWHLARAIYGAHRLAWQVGARQGRWRAARDFLRSLKISFPELLPALRGRPAPVPVTLPASPDWDDFPPPAPYDLSTPPVVSVIVALGESLPDLRLCLDSLRCQRFSQIEVLVALDDGQQEAKALVAALDDARFSCIPVPADLATAGRFNHATQRAQGNFCKFIGPDCPLLYPYALEIEVALLERRSTYPFVSAGRAAFTLGGLALSAGEALAFDAASDGACLRVDPSCVLLRRAALEAEPFAVGAGEWAMYGLLCRLAARSGALLGPYGLSTAWRRCVPVPADDLPSEFQELLLLLHRGIAGGLPAAGWAELVAAGHAVESALQERCQWHDPSWLLADLAAVDG